MNLDKTHIKIFPAHEEVFAGNIEQYKKTFFTDLVFEFKSCYHLMVALQLDKSSKKRYVID